MAIMAHLLILAPPPYAMLQHNVEVVRQYQSLEATYHEPSDSQCTRIGTPSFTG